MKVALIAPVTYSLPPKKYGGTERIVHGLAEGLTKRGHDVTLFATKDTKSSAKVVSFVDKGVVESGIKDPFGTNTWSLVHIGNAYKMSDRFDIIHDHLHEISIPTANMSRTPVLVTLHSAINETNKYLYESLDSPNYVTISHSQRRPLPTINYGGNVYNGLNMEHYPFSLKDKGYLLYVGRISREKGVHYAIEAALKLNLPLIIAAKITQVEDDINYFNRYVKPKLSKQIRWIGEVDEEQRNELMANALCFLHPVTWPEPFGLTLIEAMACGCPVVAFSQGSIPELIVDGKTGFVVETVSQMIASIKKIKQIDRAYCRQHALDKFNMERMITGYEKAYREVIKHQKVLKAYRKQSRKYKRSLDLADVARRQSKRFIISPVLYSHDVRSQLVLPKKKNFDDQD